MFLFYFTKEMEDFFLSRIAKPLFQYKFIIFISILLSLHTERQKKKQLMVYKIVLYLAYNCHSGRNVYDSLSDKRN